MLRRVIAGLVVVGLAIGIWVLWPREEPSPSPTTTIHAVASSTSTKVATRTTGSTVDSHVVTTVEEAEDILRQLWFGWFEGIYNQDEERIKEVVATQALLDSALSQFGQMEFAQTPTRESIRLSEVEMLRSDANCLVIWAIATADFRSGSTQGAHVLRRVDDGWLLASLWTYKEDLWEADCESQLESLS